VAKVNSNGYQFLYNCQFYHFNEGIDVNINATYATVVHKLV